MAAEKGTDQVLWPVVATVLTTIVAFLPLSFIQGRIGELLGSLPLVVACALAMSLIEALLILPSHMGHTLRKRDASHPKQFVSRVRRLERWRDRIVLDRMVPAYGRMLAFLLRNRYAVVASALAMLLISASVVRSGYLTFNFLPSSDSETIVVDLHAHRRADQSDPGHCRRIEQAAEAQPETESVASVIGQQANIESGQKSATSPHVAQMFVELKYVEQRERTSGEVIAAIRNKLQGQLAPWIASALPKSPVGRPARTSQWKCVAPT